MREGRAALMSAEPEIVCKRIDMLGLHVRVRIQIQARVEADRGIAPLFPTERMIVVERIDARSRHIGVGRKVAVYVE